MAAQYAEWERDATLLNELGNQAGLLERLFNESGLAAFRVEPDESVSGWSDLAAELLGYPADQVIGARLEQVIALAEIPAFRKALNKASRGRGVRPFEQVLHAADGRELRVRVSCIGAPRGESRAAPVYFLLQDVSERIRAIEQHERSAKTMRALFQAVSDAVVMLNEAGTITQLNPAAERMFGFVAHELVGGTVERLVPEDIRERFDGSVEAFVSEQVDSLLGRTLEAEARRRNGESFPVEVTLAAIEEQGSRSFAGIVRDISERKRQEQMLRELNENLSHEVEQRIEANEALKQALIDLEEAQAHLLQKEKMASLGATVAGVAHEINTPLGISITAASMLASRTRQFSQGCESGDVDGSTAARFAETAEEAVDIMQTNLRRAADLVKSFKQVAVDQTSDRRRAFDVSTLIHETLRTLEPELGKTEHRVEIDCEAGLRVEGHAGDLTRILINLIMNSLLHGYPDGAAGCLRIRAGLEGERLRIVYSDDGAGMNDEQRSKLFEPFYTTRRNSGGTGLGMHIVFNLVHREEGGAITLKSAPGKGAEFTLYLPVTPA